jgi:hypothetical protein
MSVDRRKLNGLEAFLVDSKGETSAEDIADLQKSGVDVNNFLKRVAATVQAGYSEQLRLWQSKKPEVLGIFTSGEVSDDHD